MSISIDNNHSLSLEERLLRMAASDNHNLPDFSDDYEEEGEEEIIEEISETELLKYLDQQESPLSVVQRLFYQNTLCDLECLSPTAMEELYSRGWTEIEGMIDTDILKGAHKEAEMLLQENQFTPAKDLKENDPYRDVGARDDAVIWFASENAPPNFQAVLKFISGPIHKDLSRMIHLYGQTEYQLAYYHPKGAHYERHRDSLPTSDLDDTFQRRITVIFYLNPGWTEGDGGEIKIFGDQDRLVKPMLGRMLIFMSGAIDHEVLPTKKPRFALTSWMR